jgi:hypothetical protein
MADADRNSIESLQSALRVAGRLSSKRGEVVDALITILEHKPFLPLNEDEKKLLQQLKEQKEEKGKTPKTSDTPAPESTPTTQAEAATKAETPQETYWSLKVTRPVELKDSVGRVVARLQQGQSVQYVGRDNYLVRVRYDGADYDIRISSIDLK